MSIPKAGAGVVVIAVVFTVLALAALLLRLWSRHLQKARPAFNDYALIAGMIFCVAYISVITTAVFRAGLGEHLQTVLARNPAEFALFLKLFVAGQQLWAAANTCVKFSILSLYIIIFPNNRVFHWLCYGAMIATTAYLISVILEAFLLCKPVQYSWDKSIPNGTCKGENTAFLIAGIMNLLIDAFVVALPMPLLFRLKMSLMKRLSIAAMFGLGIVICVVSLLRVIWLQTWDLNDLTYSAAMGAIWTTLEPTLGVVNACLPTMMPAINKIFGPGSFGFTQHGSTGGSSRSKSGMSSAYDRRKPASVTDPKHRDFERLDDEYPLTSIQADPSLATRSIESGGAITVTRHLEWESSLPK